MIRVYFAIIASHCVVNFFALLSLKIDLTSSRTESIVIVALCVTTRTQITNSSTSARGTQKDDYTSGSVMSRYKRPATFSGCQCQKRSFLTDSKAFTAPAIYYVFRQLGIRRQEEETDALIEIPAYIHISTEHLSLPVRNSNISTARMAFSSVDAIEIRIIHRRAALR